MKDQAKLSLMVQGRQFTAGKTREMLVIVIVMRRAACSTFGVVGVVMSQPRDHLCYGQVMMKVGNPVKVRPPLRRRERDDENPAQQPAGYRLHACPAAISRRRAFDAVRDASGHRS